MRDVPNKRILENMLLTLLMSYHYGKIDLCDDFFLVSRHIFHALKSTKISFNEAHYEKKEGKEASLKFLITLGN